jgi:O-antigen/teichoic acid export membrane protein
VEVLLFAVTLHILSHLTPWQQLEIFCIVVGVGLLVLGHLGWYREQAAERQSDLVGFSLVFGSLLAGIPLAIATLYWRFIARDISSKDEIGLLAVGIVLLVTGFLFQLRATTLTGGTLLVCELIMLLVSAFLHVKDQVAIAIFLAGGGAVIFLTGLLLSIYRDRLLALPEKVKRREGIFRVLGWR